MLAWAAHEKIDASFRSLREDNVPSHIVIRDIVHRLAGPDTVTAPNTQGQVNDHVPLVGNTFILLMICPDNSLD